MQISEGTDNATINGHGSAYRNCADGNAAASISSGKDINDQCSGSDSEHSDVASVSTSTFMVMDRESRSSTQSSQPPPLPKKASRKNSMAQDYKVEELRNEIRDLERRLKNTEYENQGLKRIQARHERELLKAEMSRHDGADLKKPYVEEVRALRRLLAEGKDKQREYEKKLRYRHMEIQRLKQELNSTHQQAQERDVLLEKEEASLKKIGKLEKELRDRETEAVELRRKLDQSEAAHRQDLELEKTHNREIRQKLQELRAQHRELLERTKNAVFQSGNLRKGATSSSLTNGKEPKDAFNSYVMSLDQERKEWLLAKLKEIDLNGHTEFASFSRQRSPRRYSMGSICLPPSGPRAKSPVRRPSRGALSGTNMLGIGIPVAGPAASLERLGERRFSDTFPKSQLRRKSFLENLDEADTAEFTPLQRHQSTAYIFESSNMRPDRTVSSRSSGGSVAHKGGSGFFPDLEAPTEKAPSQRFFPWEQKTTF